jgi:hypothetical protein
MKLLATVLMSTLGASVSISPSAPPPQWQETLTPAKAGDFAPLRPLKAKYKFGWAAVPAGHAETEFTKKDDHFQLHVTGASSGLVRKLWRLDADGRSTVLPANLHTTKLVQTETYSDEKRTTTVEFGPEGACRSRVRVPAAKKPDKTKCFKFAPVRDLHGALLFVRSQGLRDGDVIRMVVYPNASPYLAEVRVLAHEKVNVAGQSWPGIKLDLKLKEISKKLELEPDKKFKSAAGWLSDDKDRLLLKVESEIFVGKVWMELQQVEFLEKRG